MATTTPWGMSQTKRKLAVGINLYTTASHGGYKISAKRNLSIPAYMRNENGWYEEDCEWSIPGVVFRDVFENIIVDGKSLYEIAKNVLMNWYPDFYEKWFNTSVSREDSYIRNKQMEEEENKDKFVVCSAVGVNSSIYSIPKGTVLVWLKRSSDNNEIVKLVPKDEYNIKFTLNSEDIDKYEDYII